MLACELADDRGLPGVVPGQRKRTVRELLGVRNIEGRRQRWHLAELFGSQDLCDFDDPGLISLEIGDRDRTVACAEVDTKTETNAHGAESWLRGFMDWPQRRRAQSCNSASCACA